MLEEILSSDSSGTNQSPPRFFVEPAPAQSTVLMVGRDTFYPPTKAFKFNLDTADLCCGAVYAERAEFDAEQSSLSTPLRISSELVPTVPVHLEEEFDVNPSLEGSA